MILTFRPIKVWPDGWHDNNRRREGSPFSATYSSTLQLLEQELFQLGATEAFLQVDASERDVRLDGQLRADAKVEHPGCILTIGTRRHGTLIYSTDRYVAGWRRGASWQHNLRAIALGLEALRKVERYGIAERGQQYAGYRELGAGLPMPAARMTVDEAAAFLIQHGEWGSVNAELDDLIGEPEVVAMYFKEAAKKLHPDVGGDPALFRRLTEARDLLIGGVS